MTKPIETPIVWIRVRHKNGALRGLHPSFFFTRRHMRSCTCSQRYAQVKVNSRRFFSCTNTRNITEHNRRSRERKRLPRGGAGVRTSCRAVCPPPSQGLHIEWFSCRMQSAAASISGEMDPGNAAKLGGGLLTLIHLAPPRPWYSSGRVGEGLQHDIVTKSRNCNSL